MFSPGDAVLSRELWRDSVMTAIPLRVVSDSPQRTVLYLARDTAFRGARTPGGGKVRDLDDWVSADCVWAGGSVLQLVEPDSWHCVEVEFGPSGAFDGWYVNFQTPVRRTHRGFDFVDLVLDLVVSPSGAVRRKDEDDFAAAVRAGHIPPEWAAEVLADAERMTAAVAATAPPFSERGWLSWRPPAGWTPPPLPADRDSLWIS